jgi:hypothetical protein
MGPLSCPDFAVFADGMPTMSDDHMIGPGAHEQAAHSSSMEGDNETAMVYAVLALASAVNRLAAAQEVIANKD